jgi:hypothetical protein
MNIPAIQSGLSISLLPGILSIPGLWLNILAIAFFDRLSGLGKNLALSSISFWEFFIDGAQMHG